MIIELFKDNEYLDVLTFCSHFSREKIHHISANIVVTKK